MFSLINENEYLIQKEIFVTMSDGVRLYTRITLPKGKDKYPVVFIRTPYDKQLLGEAYDINEAAKCDFIKNGYAVVRQHCRGTGDSEGICVPYEEKNDGLETLDFIRNQSFYNGEIYLCGSSYLTTVHLCYLDSVFSDIKAAAFNIQTDRMYFRNYRNGCCYDFCNIGWWLRMLKRQHPVQNHEEILKKPYADIMKRVLGTDIPEYTNCLINDTYNEFWTNDSRTYVIDNLKFPVLLTEGWYDFYTEGMFSMWERLPENIRRKSAITVGPWGHATKVKEETEYPLPNGNIPQDFAVKWFNSIRDDVPYEYAECGKVKYYSTGADEWKTAVYPPEKTALKRLYFNANHTLSKQNGTGSFTYKYNPEQRHNAFKYMNIHKSHEKNSISGILSFESDEFDADESFFGEIRWHMNVATDCEDTAFFIRVYIVENNDAYNITETITSVNHLKNDYIPGEKLLIDIKTPPAGFTVKKGCKIRADISSDGGIYVPNANVKGHWAKITECKTANNTVFCDNSYIELTRV